MANYNKLYCKLNEEMNSNSSPQTYKNSRYLPPDHIQSDDTAQRVLSKNTVLQYKDAISKLQSNNTQLQKQGSEELLQLVMNPKTGTEQDKQEVQELILANSKTPPTKEKVSFLSSKLGIAPIATIAILLAAKKYFKHKRLYGKTKIPPRLLSEVVCLYREGYLSRDNALLALKVLKS